MHFYHIDTRILIYKIYVSSGLSIGTVNISSSILLLLVLLMRKQMHLV